MTEIVEYSTAFHEKYHQLDCLHFGRNKIVLTYNEYFRFTKVATWTFPPCIFRNPFYFFVKQVLRYGTMNFERFFMGHPAEKQTVANLLMQNRQHGHGKRQGVRTEKGDEGNDGYRSINVVRSKAPKSWGLTSRVRFPEIFSPAYLRDYTSYPKVNIDALCLITMPTMVKL